jgi:hypothetical protein
MNCDLGINYVRVVKFIVVSIKLNGGKSMVMSLRVFSYEFFCISFLVGG